MGTPAMSKQAEFCLDSAAPIDTSSLPVMFQSCTLAKQGSIINGNGTRGTRQHDSTRTAAGPYRCSGQIVMTPTADELEYWLARIQGTAKDGSNDFVPAESVPEWVCMRDLVSKTATYAGCKVGRATFSAQAGQALTLALDVEAETETIGSAGGFPSLTYASDSIYVMSGAAVTIAGTGSREISSFECVIDNVLDTERFRNSTTRTEIPSQDRVVSLTLGTPYSTDETDLYDLAAAGVAVIAAFTNAGGDVLTFTFAKWQVPSQGPGIAVPQEIRLNPSGQCLRDASSHDLVIRQALAA